MKLAPWPLVELATRLALSAVLGPVAEVARGAEEPVPLPSMVFTPRSAFMLYVDSAGAQQSGIGKLIAQSVPKWTEQVPNLPNLRALPASAANGLPALKSLEGTQLAELAATAEPEDVFQGISAGKPNPKASFLVAIRLVPAVDANALVGELLSAAEKESAGVSNKVMASRAKLGAADIYDLPAEALKSAKIPFALSVAIGPAKEGTVLALGRSESVKDFVGGKRSGELPVRINNLLPERRHVWLYAPIPADAMGNLRSAPGGNPMLAGMAGGMDQVREIGFNLGFGDAALEVEVALGCADNAGAQKLAEGMQGMLSMMQMMAAQNPAAAPAFLGSVKSATDARRFVLKARISRRDIEKALASSEKAIAGNSPRPGTSAARPAASPPAEAPSPCPVDLQFQGILPGEGMDFREGKMRVTNRAKKAVRDVEATFNYVDAKGRWLGKWKQRQGDLMSDTLVGPETNRVVQCQLFRLPFGTDSVQFTIHEVLFADGERWTPKR